VALVTALLVIGVACAIAAWFVIREAGRMAAEASRLWQRYLTRPARVLRALWMPGVRMPGVTIGG